MTTEALTLAQYAELPQQPLQLEQQPGWLSLLQQHCLPDHKVRVYVDMEDGTVGSALPLYPLQKSFMGLRARYLRGLTAMYSSHYCPVSEDVESLQRLLADVLEQESWDVLFFSAVDEVGYLHRALKQLAAERKLPLSCSKDFEHWYLDLQQADYRSYLAQRPGILRNTLKRKEEKISREFQVEFDICDTTESLPAALAAYQQVYSRSWKTAELYPDFIPQFCQWAAAEGWLRLGIMRLDDKPIAAQIWLVLNGRASIFKLAYDQAYRQWSVGSLLTAHLMQQVINEGVTEVEFGKGGESYKADWMSQCRQRVQLACYNPLTWVGRCMALRHHYLPGIIKKRN